MATNKYPKKHEVAAYLAKAGSLRSLDEIQCALSAPGQQRANLTKIKVCLASLMREELARKVGERYELVAELRKEYDVTNDL